MNRSPERGSALIEFAVSLIVVITLILGCMETCIALYCFQVVTEYARLAARYAMVHGSTCTYTVNGALTSCFIGPNNPDGTNTALFTYLQSASLLGVSPSNLQVRPVFSPAPGASACVSAGCTGAGDLVTVTVTYLFPYSVPFVPGQTLSMSSRSATVISQ